jgi:hypothetical protein
MGRLKIAIFLLLLSFSPAAAQTSALMVDTSKSMRPYYDSGLMSELNRTLYSILQSRSTSTVAGFDTNVATLSGIDRLDHPQLGDWTYLDRAVQFAIRRPYSIAWLITDNIQSQSSDPEAANTAVFYQELRSRSIQKVVVFPLRQTAGRSGLIIYALLIAPEAEKEFTDEVNEFTQRSKNTYRTEALQMKPLDLNTVELHFSADDSAKKGIKTYKVGQKVRESFEARFKSRFEHLRIVEGNVEVPTSKPVFAESSLLAPERREINIDPQKIVSLDPQSESESAYLITADLGNITLKKNLASLWKAAWGKNYEDVTLDVLFTITVPRENFKFKDTFISDYCASSRDAAKSTGKIYGLDQLPILMTDASTSITAKNTIGFRVQYGWWPALFWFLLAAVAFVLLIIFIVVIRRGVSGRKRNPGWVVTAQTPQGAELDCKYDQDRVAVLGTTVGTIENQKLFVAQRDVKVEGGSSRTKIMEGVPVRIVQKDRSTILTFKKAGSKKIRSAPAGAPKYVAGHTPRRR